MINLNQQKLITPFVIRGFKSPHCDVFLKEGRRGDIKIIFKNLLNGQIIKMLSADNLNQVKEILSKS
jgi:predicted DNA-binding antitoxin AbrB/MazE fold protein